MRHRDTLKLYYAHQTVNREEARHTELKIEEATGIELDNPFYDGEAKEVKELDATGKSSLNKFEITAVDENKVRHADGILAFLGVDKLALGTNWEMCECVCLWGKPLYVISPFDSILEHPFLVKHGVPTFRTAYEFIKYANENLVDKNESKVQGV